MRKSTIKRLSIQQEANVKECKVCHEKKLRILYGKFPSMNNKYVDESGSLWSGRICPLCNNARIKAKMQNLRAGRKIKISPEEAATITDSLELRTNEFPFKENK